MSKMTKNQTLVLEFLEKSGGKATWADIRSGIGTSQRRLNVTIRSCIDRGWVVWPNTDGSDLHYLTDAGRAALK